MGESPPHVNGMHNMCITQHWVWNACIIWTSTASNALKIAIAFTKGCIFIPLPFIIILYCSTSVHHMNTSQLSSQSEGYNHSSVHALWRQEPNAPPHGPQHGVDRAWRRVVSQACPVAVACRHMECWTVSRSYFLNLVSALWEGIDISLAVDFFFTMKGKQKLFTYSEMNDAPPDWDLGFSEDERDKRRAAR